MQLYIYISVYLFVSNKKRKHKFRKGKEAQWRGQRVEETPAQEATKEKLPVVNKHQKVVITKESTIVRTLMLQVNQNFTLIKGVKKKAIKVHNFL